MRDPFTLEAGSEPGDTGNPNQGPPEAAGWQLLSDLSQLFHLVLQQGACKGVCASYREAQGLGGEQDSVCVCVSGEMMNLAELELLSLG